MIEHHDHTGNSNNPHAPWNQIETDIQECEYCERPIDDHDPECPYREND